MLSTLTRGLPRSLPGGEKVRVHPRWRSMSWNLLEYAAFKAAILQGGCLLDVGANVGAYSLLMGQWVGPKGHVYAFEPNPYVADGLALHVSLNGLEDRITVVRKAVCDRQRKCEFSFGDSIGNGHLIDTNETHPPSKQVVVETTSLDEFCRLGRIHPQFIKVDVEGAEFEVLQGAKGLIRSWSHGLKLFVELHPTVWKAQGRSKEDWIVLLDRLSLKMVPIAPGFDPWSLEGVCVELIPNRKPGEEGQKGSPRKGGRDGTE